MASETRIHPTAVVDPGAKLGADVSVGPFCVVDNDTVVGDRVQLSNSVTVLAGTALGAGCKVFPQAVLGAPPQNLKHKGGRTSLIIGENCVIRESVTMHTGSDGSHGATTVGSNGYFMAYAHIAHDCIVGDNVTMANAATLGGHVEVGNNVTIGGLSAVHQFVRIGDYAFIGGCSAIMGDVIPFAMVVGNRAKLRGLNVVGLRRSGLTRSQIHEMKAAYDAMFDPARPVAENLALARTTFASSAPAMKMIEFFSARGKRPFVVPPISGAGSGDDTEAA